MPVYGPSCAPDLSYPAGRKIQQRIARRSIHEIREPTYVRMDGVGVDIHLYRRPMLSHLGGKVDHASE